MNPDVNHILGKYWNTANHSDITIVTSDGVKFKAHKFILAIRSKYFEALFKYDNKDLLNLDVTSEVWTIISKAMYGVNIPESELIEVYLDVLIAADFLDLNILADPPYEKSFIVSLNDVIDYNSVIEYANIPTVWRFLTGLLTTVNIHTKPTRWWTDDTYIKDRVHRAILSNYQYLTTEQLVTLVTLMYGKPSDRDRMMDFEMGDLLDKLGIKSWHRSIRNEHKYIRANFPDVVKSPVNYTSQMKHNPNRLALPSASGTVDPPPLSYNNYEIIRRAISGGRPERVQKYLKSEDFPTRLLKNLTNYAIDAKAPVSTVFILQKMGYTDINLNTVVDFINLVHAMSTPIKFTRGSWFDVLTNFLESPPNPTDYNKDGSIIFPGRWAIGTVYLDKNATSPLKRNEVLVPPGYMTVPYRTVHPQVETSSSEEEYVPQARRTIRTIRTIPRPPQPESSSSEEEYVPQARKTIPRPTARQSVSEPSEEEEYVPSSPEARRTIPQSVSESTSSEEEYVPQARKTIPRPAARRSESESTSEEEYVLSPKKSVPPPRR